MYPHMGVYYPLKWVCTPWRNIQGVHNKRDDEGLSAPKKRISSFENICTPWFEIQWEPCSHGGEEVQKKVIAWKSLSVNLWGTAFPTWGKIVKKKYLKLIFINLPNSITHLKFYGENHPKYGWKITINLDNTAPNRQKWTKNFWGYAKINDMWKRIIWKNSMIWVWLGYP